MHLLLKKALWVCKSVENLVTLTCFDSEYGGSMQYVKNDVQIGEEEVN